jgi:3-O-methylgallate 3,4-dioxygenase
MAQLVGILHTSHGPLTYSSPDTWDAYRAKRVLRSDVPAETHEEQIEKANRSKAGIAALNAKLLEMNPDVIVIFGDDQKELYGFNNFPTLSVYTGESFTGPEIETRGRPELFHTVPGHPGLAIRILRSFLAEGFDPAFSQTDPNPEKGMCHAVMNPLQAFHNHSIPTVPVLVNAYYPPQITAMRCYQIGRVIRKAIDEYPEEIRVVVIGSGGLWHTPGRPEAFLDEEFDRKCLSYLELGDIREMAEYFDAYRVADDDPSQQMTPDVQGMTGMPPTGGPQFGTRETCNWIGAAAVADGRPNVVVDYIPMYASPIGTAFAYCDSI